MFDRLKKALGDIQEIAGHPGHHRPGSAPEAPAEGPLIVPGMPGGLVAVGPAVIGAYIGVPVESVTPLSVGPEARGSGNGTSEQGLPEVNGAQPLEPGEMVAGQHAGREARMREQGMSEEQIAIVRAKIGKAVTEHRQNAWTVNFATGTHASVQVFDLGDEHGDFGRFKKRYEYQVTHTGFEDQSDNLILGQVRQVRGAHYESYRLGGVVVAAGRSHEATARSAHADDPDADDTLAALAALGLYIVEG